MKTSLTSLWAVALFVFFVGEELYGARAWRDEGHLIVAAVARLQLTDEEAKILEYPLKYFSDEYPGLNTLVTAAIWMDRYKCLRPSAICVGTPNLDGLKIFDAWHWISILYNPQEITLHPRVAQMPYPQTGAVWALNQALASQVPQQFNRTIPDGDLKKIKASKRTISENQYTERDAKLSRFTWNIRLRLLLHILGDLHQPLHATELVTTRFPGGDLGGNLIKVVVKDQPALTNLHRIWDACGGAHTGVWPDYTEQNAVDAAKALIKKYPAKEINPGSVTTIEDIAHETHKLAISKVYTEFNFVKNPAPDVADSFIPNPYVPSDAYLKNVTEVCLRQLTLGGYRLAMVLKDLAEIARHGEWIQEEKPSPPANDFATKPATSGDSTNRFLL